MNANTWLALVALDKAELPAPRSVLDRLADEAIKLSSATAAMATFEWGDATLAYTLVDRPIPADQLAGPAARAWYWPEAAEQLGKHKAHLIVALVDDGSSRIDKSMKLTKFVAAFLPKSQALGLQWGASRAVHEPLAFVQVAQQLARDDLPLHLWLDFQVETSSNGDLRLYTTGMEALGKLELEVPRFTGPTQQLVNHVYNLAHYILEKDSLIKDSEVIGLPGEVQVTVRDTVTFLEGDQQVLAFDFD